MLKFRTERYHWFEQNKSGSDRIIKINPTGEYTISKQFDLGKVDDLWSVQELCSSFLFCEYANVLMRDSCWIIEEHNRDFYCDCCPGMKGKLCHHTNGIPFKKDHLEPTFDVK